MRHSTRFLALGASAAVLASLAACGTSSSNGSGSGPGTSDVKGEPITIGTTDTVVNLDPAGSYDEGSWTLQYNLFQTPLTIPAGQNTPEGDAAKSCSYTNPSTFKCILQPNLKFSNGDPLTAEAVKYSIERNIRISDPNGASSLLSDVAHQSKSGALSVNPSAISVPNSTTVIFHLSKPDTVFQYVLTTPAADIVDPKVYPADKELKGNKVVGSGPYELQSYNAGTNAVFVPNKYYTGPNKAQAPRIFMNYYSEASALAQAVKTGAVDVAWHGVSPQEQQALTKDSNLTVYNGKGSEIRYWVWQTNGPVGKNIAIRRAVAYLINRQQIAKLAYDGTVKPLYSIVPPGFPGQINAFETAYGATPNKAKAAKELSDAGVKTPINLTIGYTPSHYGPNAVDEATQVQRQLNGSGLFNVTLKSAEWTQYLTLSKQKAYDMYMLGWYPDYLDADDYLAPFLVDGGFYANGYHNAQVNALVAAEEATSDQATRVKDFEKLQTIAARDVPFIPSWVGSNTGIFAKDVHGVQTTLDPSFIFRFWDLTKGS